MHAKRRSRSRGGAWALLCAGVLLLHLLLLPGLRPPPRMPGEGGALTLQVRTIAAAAPRFEVEPPPAAGPAAPRRGAALAPAPPRLRGPAAPLKTAPPVASAPPEPPAVAPAPLPGAAPRAAAGDAPWPVYATRLPAAAELHYRLLRGELVGHARLQWQPGDAAYALRLDQRWPGQAQRGAASRGLLDAAGVAPVRHAELQRDREVRAVNFQREAGLITFSGPQLSYALHPGAQDRLSWLIQLPAIVEADAALARTGTALQLFVAGPRGDAEAWRFEVQGRETLDLPAGAVAQALHLRRAPTRPYDTLVDVWLDPARQHLPVRVAFTTVPGGVPLRMELAPPAEPREPLEIEAAAPR